MSTPTVIAAYLALFVAVGGIFLLVNLLVGKLVRPDNPSPEKGEIYECGEPTIGSSFVQFDLRFYVVALLFLIFDVEVAFFFPWAVVFGKANHLSDATVTAAAADGIQREMGLGVSDVVESELPQLAAAANDLAWLTFSDILVFFGVLMVGFAYVWYRGDLNWVRAHTPQRTTQLERLRLDQARQREQALSA
jgi:NADH-quinone oxidoreductase subunit A